MGNSSGQSFSSVSGRVTKSFPTTNSSSTCRINVPRAAPIDQYSQLENIQQWKLQLHDQYWGFYDDLEGTHMPLRPTAPCSRALARPSITTADAIWVTDDVLNHAFQCFLNVSKAHRRAGSSVPGPMYHRQRLGKRGMTELNTYQTSGAIPPWALKNAPDMMQWQWEPPKPELWSPWPPPSIPPDAPTTSAPTPPELLPELLPPTEATEAVVSKHSDTDTVEELRRRNHMWQNLHNLLIEIRTKHRGDEQAHTEKFEDFLRTFVQTLSEAQISGTAAADVYETAYMDLLFMARHYPESGTTLQVRLMFSLAEGINAAKSANRKFLIGTPKFWDKYMLRVAELEPTVETADLFAFGMSNLKTRHGSRHYDIFVRSLDRFFALWDGTEIHGDPEIWDSPEIEWTSNMARMWYGRADEILQMIAAMMAKGHTIEAGFHLRVAQRCHARAQRFTMKAASLMSNDSMIVERLANGLKAKDPITHRVWYTQAQRLLGTPRKHWSRSHYNWLQILARLPAMSTNQFRTSLQLFPPRGHASLSHSELCLLLRRHWETTNRFDIRHDDPERWKVLLRTCDSPPTRREHTALADLALLIHKSNPPKESTAVLWSYWSILRDRAGPKALVRQLTVLATREKLSSGFLKILAWTSNNHDLALILHSILEKRRGKGNWWPAFWDKYAARLNTKRNHRHGPVDIVTKGLKPIPTSNDQGHIARLKAGLMLLRKNGQISDRTAFDLSTKFTVMLAICQGTLSASDLSTLNTLVTRVLDKGLTGSKERFKWYLAVIDRFLGAEVCARMQLILERRHVINWSMARRRRTWGMGKADSTPQINIATMSPRSLWSSVIYKNRNKKSDIRERERLVRERIGKYRQWIRSQLAAQMTVQTGINVVEAKSKPRPESASSTASHPSPRPLWPPLSDKEEKLFNRLRVVRQRQADKDGVHPNAVAKDALLLDLAKKQPLTSAALRHMCPNMKKHLDRYGKPWLLIIKLAVDGVDVEEWQPPRHQGDVKPSVLAPATKEKDDEFDRMSKSVCQEKAGSTASF